MNTKTIFTICLLLFGAMAVQAQGKSDLNKGAKAFKTKNYTEALEWYKKAAEKGNADAMNRIGVLYSGYLEPQDKEEAFKWFLKAAEGGNLNGITHVAGAYDRGSGVAQNPEEALKWYKIAADKGDHHSKYKVKEITATLVADAKKQTAQGIDEFKKGENAFKQQNFTEAIQLFKKSADNGNSQAMAYLGYMYDVGQGTAKNIDEAFNWYKKAIENGYTSGAIYQNLGRMYLEWRGGGMIPPNYTEALNCFQKAAEKGNAHAMYNIGIMYNNGTGVTKDLTEALKWFKKSADNGNTNAQQQIDRINNNTLKVTVFKGDNNKYGLKDGNGNIILSPKYDKIEKFSEGLAAVNIGKKEDLFDVSGKWGFIDKTGKEIIPLQYEIGFGSLYFSEGLVAVRKSGDLKYGFIDKSGKVIIPFQFEDMMIPVFENGKAKVQKDGKKFYIDKTGKEVK